VEAAHHEELAERHRDPGVRFVRRVYEDFKRRGAGTVVMAASFRSTAQVEALAGCDRLTIAPDLLDALESSHGPVVRALAAPPREDGEHAPIDAARFASDMADDLMA
jgi:transaldolase